MFRLWIFLTVPLNVTPPNRGMSRLPPISWDAQWMTPDPLIVLAAPNGAYKQASDHGALPSTPEAMAATAQACLEAGASILHLHVRDALGRHSLDAGLYRDAIAAVRQRVGQALVIQVTTEAARVYGAPAQRALVAELRPEAVSVALRELDDDPSPEGRAVLTAFFGLLARERIMTQVILYSADELAHWRALRLQGVIPEAPWFLLLVLGRYSAGQTSAPTDLLPFLASGVPQEPWAVCAFGRQEHACGAAAAALGGHVRVGFENNLHLRDGRLAPDNAALVRQVADVALALGRPLATADQVRHMFHAPI